jgi:hypothetical protein
VLPGQSAFHLAALFMWVFSAWVGLGDLWSFYPAYATTKGLAFAALALGPLAILWCGAEWGRPAPVEAGAGHDVDEEA